MSKDPKDNNSSLARGHGGSFPKRQWVGSLVGDVRVEDVLSESEHGLVMLGRQEGIGRRAVVKLLPHSGDVGGTAERRILKNAQVLSQLRHANIVTLYNVGMYEGRYPFLVMEYLPGGTIEDFIDDQGPVVLGRALGMSQQIVHALEDIHRLGAVHHNLSLGNVLIESLAGSGHDLVKLFNFGIGVGQDERRRASRAARLTPEEVMGGEYTERSDLYVCGLMLFEMLTGRLPYRTLREPALWDEIVTNKPLELSDIRPEMAQHPELQMLLDQVLSKNPSSRPINARALRLMIGQVMSDIEDRDAAMEGPAGSFPVLNTVERLPTISKQRLEDGSPAPRSRPLPPSSRPLPQAIEPKNTIKKTKIKKKTNETPLEASSLSWKAPQPSILQKSDGKPYLVLVVHSQQPMAPGLAGKHTLLLGHSADGRTVGMVFKAPKKRGSWLRRLAAKASESGLQMGLSFGRRFDAGLRMPAPNTVRVALQAAERAKPGKLVAARLVVDALSLGEAFEPLTADAMTGRGDGFSVFVGTS